MKLHLILFTLISIGLYGVGYGGSNAESDSSQTYPTAPGNPQTYPTPPSNPQTYPTPSNSTQNNTQQDNGTKDNNEKGLPPLNLKNPFGIQPIDFFGDSTSGASSWNIVDTTNSTSANVTLQPSADAFGFADEDIGAQSEGYGD